MAQGQAIFALTILSTIGDSLALLTSIFRISHRIRIFKFWWDDFWALVSLPLIVTLLICLWVQPHEFDHGTFKERVALAWLVSVAFNLCVWCARLSIACSVTRILPPGKPKIVSLCMIVFFGLVCVGVFFGKIWICARDSSWWYLPHPSCPQQEALTIVQMTTDTLSSISLVVFPLYVLWNLVLPPIERRLILSVFAAGILTTIVCLCHTIIVFIYGSGVFYGLTAHLAAGVSVTICNSLVVATRFYRFLQHSPEPPAIRAPTVDVERTSIFTDLSSQMQMTTLSSVMPTLQIEHDSTTSSHSKVSNEA